MAKFTYHNLPEEKKKLIYDALVEEFETYILSEASVSSIISRAKIARGSFYQYFEDLEDSFFTVLATEIEAIHKLFESIVPEPNTDIVWVLRKYGEVLADELYNEEKYPLYKNIYTYWNMDLDKRWHEYQEKHDLINENGYAYVNLNVEDVDQGKSLTYFANGNIQKLVENLFIEDWPREKFLEKYNMYTDWLESSPLLKKNQND